MMDKHRPVPWGRQGMERLMETLTGVVLCILAGIIFFMILGKLSGTTQGGVQSQRCTLSMTIAEKSQKNILIPDRYLLDCLPNEITLSKTDKKTGETSEDMISRRLGEEMAACWRTVNGGTLNPFGILRQHRRHVCLVCSVISFDPDLRKEVAKVSGFQSYLEASSIALDGKDTSYKEALPGVSLLDPDKFNKESNHAEDVILTNTTYATFWWVPFNSIQQILAKKEFIGLKPYRSLAGTYCDTIAN